MLLEGREAGESRIRTYYTNRELSIAYDNRMIIPVVDDHTTEAIKGLTYTSNKRNQFTPTIYAITSFQHRFQQYRSIG
jgi:hypothetical protein